MKTSRIKSMTFMGMIFMMVGPLEDDDSKYWLEVTTPQHMDVRTSLPIYNCSRAVIKEAIEAFLIEEGFKLYSSSPSLTIDDLNLILDRRKKEMQAEEVTLADIILS